MKILIYDDYITIHSENDYTHFSIWFKKHRRSEVPNYFSLFYRILASRILKNTLSYEQFNEIYNA